MSLTAMGLLWNAADLLSKMQLRSEAASSQSDAPVLSSDDFEELLRLLLGALQVRTPLVIQPLCILHCLCTLVYLDFQWIYADGHMPFMRACREGRGHLILFGEL